MLRLFPTEQKNNVLFIASTNIYHIGEICLEHIKAKQGR